MKKSVVVVLVLLAAIVLVSPAIVGRLAEKSMDESLNWAASESGAVSVVAEHYDRGWFSSEGQHRITLREGDLLKGLQVLAGPLPADDLPVLVVNTRLDHGLIPVASMSREQGSLSPGLGSAVSTLQLETPDGERIDLPGTIFSKITLTGELESKYVLEAGSRTEGDVEAAWSITHINITNHPQSGQVSFDGGAEMVFMNSGEATVALKELRFEGAQQPTKFGVSVGSLDMNLGSLSVDTLVDPANRIEPLSLSARSELDGDRVDASADMRIGFTGQPPFENTVVELAFKLDGADARALGNIQRASQTVAANADPMAMYEAMQTDLKQLFAAGFELSIDQLDVNLPQGRITSKMRFSFAETDPASFDWSALLLGTEASVELSVPAELVETFGEGNPQLAAAIGGGYLVRKGDAYRLNAMLRKGLLTVNGAPIPIPLGMN